MSLELTLAVVALILGVAALIVGLGLWAGQRRLRSETRDLTQDVRELNETVFSLHTSVGELPDQVSDLTGQVEVLDGQLSEISTAPLVARAMDHPRRVALVINPSKPEAPAVQDEVATAVREAGLPPLTVYETTIGDPGRQVALDAVAAGADVVIAAGGDGTVRHVAEGLAGQDAALGLVPLGTGNLLARNLRIPLTNRAACINTVIHGSTRRIDTVDLRVELADGSVLRNTSLVIAGAGIDAEVMGDTREQLKQRAGWLAYGEAGMRHLPGHRRDITVQLDGGAPRRHRVRSVMVANCGELAGGIDFVPEARLDDGLLDVVLLSPRHFVDWVRIAAKTLTRSRATIPMMETHQATRCRVVIEEPMISQIDGDALGQARVIDARIRADALRLQVPAGNVPDSAAAPVMTDASAPEQHL